MDRDAGIWVAECRSKDLKWGRLIKGFFYVLFNDLCREYRVTSQTFDLSPFFFQFTLLKFLVSMIWVNFYVSVVVD
jgi:hypothetical protein